MIVDGSREPQREEAIRLAEDASTAVGKSSSNCQSVWVRGRGRTRSKEVLLGTWKGERSFFNSRGRRTCNKLAARRLPSFAVALAARA